MILALPAEFRRYQPFVASALLVSLASCSHSDAFAPHGNGTTVPFAAAVPTILTYNSADDRTAAWLPDGSAFLYAFGTTTREHDQCLGLLPAAGGRRLQEICNTGVGSSDSTDTFAFPAVSAGGAVAYLRNSRPISAQRDQRSVLVSTTLDDPKSIVRLRSFPYQGPDAFYVTASSPAWLSESRLAFVAMVDHDVPCPNPLLCQVFTVQSGRDIVVAEVTGGAALTQTVSNTEWASSVAASADPGVVYYTKAGSSQVFALNVDGGGSTPIHDFGAAGIARDVHAAGGMLAAIVGGVVKVWSDGITTDPLQEDTAGRLFLVNLASGQEVELAAPETLFRHPALSPDGSRVVVESYKLLILSSERNGVVSVDTLVRPGVDLWEFQTQ
jgi:hypothetical protein